MHMHWREKKISSSRLKTYLRMAGYNVNCPKCNRVLKFERHKRHDHNYKAEVWCECGHFAGMFWNPAFSPDPLDKGFTAYDDVKARQTCLANMDYMLYLLTPEWQEKRERLIKKANHVCQWCKQHGHILQLHHLTYV